MLSNPPLSELGLEGWEEFMRDYSLEELQFAFGERARGESFPPKPGEIRSLCLEHRREHRADAFENWKADREQAETQGKIASLEDYAKMNAELKSFAAPPPKHYPPDDPRYISGIIPTSAELAEQLVKNGHERFIGMRTKKPAQKAEGKAGA